MTKAQKVYESIDEKMRRPKWKEAMQCYAKSKGFTHYTEFVCEKLKTCSAEELVAEMKADDLIKTPSAQDLKNLKYRVASILAGGKECRTESCKNKVPKNNWWYCSACARANAKVNVDPVFHRVGN